MTTWRVKPAPCPICRASLDAISTTRDADAGEPLDGDYTVCTYCLTLLRLGPFGSLTPVGPNALAAMPPAERAEIDRATRFARGMRDLRDAERRVH